MDLEQPAGVPGVLGGEQVGGGEHVEGAQRDVAGVADRRRDEVEPGRERGAAGPAGRRVGPVAVHSSFTFRGPDRSVPTAACPQIADAEVTVRDDAVNTILGRSPPCAPPRSSPGDGGARRLRRRPRTGGGSDDGIAVDAEPAGPGRAARAATAPAIPGREQIARSLENAARLAQADLRNATIDLVVYPTAGTTGGGAAAASQAVAEGAKIIVGPLFSTETAGAQPVAAPARAQRPELLQQPLGRGRNVYILGTTFENTADRLVAYGLSRGPRNFGVVYPAGLEGETARDAVGRARSAAAAPTLVDLAALQPLGRGHPGRGRPDRRGAERRRRQRGRSSPTARPAGSPSSPRRCAATASPPTQAQFMGMQRWDVSAEALPVPSLQGGVFAAPDPALLGAFTGRYQRRLRRERRTSSPASPTTASPRSAR